MVELKTVETVDTSPFKKLVVTIGELPTSFVESMTYYELLAWFTNYLQNTIIPAVNNNGEAVTELQEKFVELKNFVDTYFENLDVQEEINNKLDEMATDGTLQEIITTYIQANVAWTFDTVADMKSSTNLIAGSYAQTLGYRSVNDGGGAFYRISNTGTANEMDVVAIGSTLYAHLMPATELVPEMFGAYGDATHDDTMIIQACIDYVSGKPIKLLLKHTYLIKPIQQATDDNTKYICLNLRTDVTIEGLGDITGFVIEDANTNSNKYNAVIYCAPDLYINNVKLKNFKFYQNSNHLSAMGSTYNNPRFIIMWWAHVKNAEIYNVTFDHVYSTDVVNINNANSDSSNIVIKNCVFNFHSIRDTVDYYDCSIIYMKCHDYVFNDNILNGDNYACVGGLECHGFNGTAKNNVINEFQNCINVEPSGYEPANIECENNKLHGYDGIVLWDNKTTGATTGLYDIKLLNNYIQVESSANTLGESATAPFGGIRMSDATFTHPVNNLFIENNVIEFVNIGGNTVFSAAGTGGIVLNRNHADLNNIFITNNTITNSVSSGIQVGSTASGSTDTISNVIIENNVIRDNGLIPATNLTYDSTILISFKYLKNIVVRNNILINDISGQGSKYAFNVQGSIVTGYECYFTDNIVKTVNSTTDYMTIQDTAGFLKKTLRRFPLLSENGTVYYVSVNNQGELTVSS